MNYFSAEEFLNLLAKNRDNIIVSSAILTEQEIVLARVENRFWVDPNTACGYAIVSATDFIFGS